MLGRSLFAKLIYPREPKNIVITSPTQAIKILSKRNMRSGGGVGGARGRGFGGSTNPSCTTSDT